jgi:NADH-quinone oxidoreductase subunit A
MVLTSTVATEYWPVLTYFRASVGLSGVILGASYIFAPQAPDAQKLSAYECGFDAFGDARSRFDVRFYLVSILFIVFDLEATYLFPWSVTLGDIGSLGFWTRVDFIVELRIGFVYAWKRGALEWA